MSMSSSQKIAVLGAGNMGTAIAQLVAKNGYIVNLWNYEGDPEPLRQIAEFRENKKYSPGIKLFANIKPEPDLKKAVKDAVAVFFAVPSSFMDSTIRRAAPYLAHGTVCVDASKGLDEKSLGLIPDVIRKNLPKKLHAFVTTISGPAIANDMAKGIFTAMNVSGKNKKAMGLVKKLMESESLKLRATTDVIGVEVTGSFKNVYAIAMGICDGLGLTMNTKAALLVSALKEIGALVKKMGGRTGTVYDLAGLGDLVGTGLCAISRNRRFGECLAKGLRVKEAAGKVGQVVEGVNASKVLQLLGKKHRVKLPFAEMIYGVVWKERAAEEEMRKFLREMR